MQNITDKLTQINKYVINDGPPIKYEWDRINSSETNIQKTPTNWPTLAPLSLRIQKGVLLTVQIYISCLFAPKLKTYYDPKHFVENFLPGTISRLDK